jgi:hypothetical protein
MTERNPIRECFDALSADVLLTPGYTAEVLAVSPKTLEEWRAKNIRPPLWLKLGDPLGKTSPVRYRVGDLRDMLRGSCSTISTAAATAARASEIDGLDEPALRPGRSSRHPSAMAFLSSANSDDAWPFLLAGIERRPLDAVATMGSSIDGEIEWLTLADYAEAWRDAERVIKAIDDNAVLRQTTDQTDYDTTPQRRKGNLPGGM